MAASGKKKNKKGKTLNLNEFLAGPGSGAPPAAAPISWADEMDEALDDDVDLSTMKLNIDRSILPTAPRAARGPDIDMSKVPTQPPFTAFLGNLPYDVEEEDIMRFFRDQNVLNVRLPQDGGRLKGFGYAEFPDRTTLLEALAMNEAQLKNRKIRIDLAGSSNEGGRDGGGGRGRRDDDGEDRTAGDWRRAPKSDDGPGGYDRRDDRGGDRDRGFGNRGYSDRGGSRDGGYDSGRPRYGTGYNRDRDFGDRDRGFGGGQRRGYSPPRDRGNFERREASPTRERPRLSLQPRTKPVENANGTETRSSIFGDAKPVDTTRYEEKSREQRLRDDKPRYEAPADRYREPPRERSSYNRPREDRPPHHDEATERPQASGERPKLNLQKRSKPLEADSSKTDKAASIFGGAKPVNTAAKELEIEARLQREREQELESTNRERRLSSEGHQSQRSSRTRIDSATSADGEQGKQRARKLSSSSSGKGMPRTVAPPPGVGSARVRRDSTLSDGEADVFEDNTSPPMKSPPVKDAPTKFVPAPPPAENPWLKRKEATAPQASKTEQPSAERTAEPPRPNNVDKENVVPSSAPSDNAWKKGRPDIAGAPAPSREQRAHSKTAGPESSDNAWARGKPRTDGPPRGGPRGGGDRGGRGGYGAARGRGQEASKPRQRPEKPLPQSIDEMPKAEDLEEKQKDLADSNKFAMLLADDDEAQASD